MCDKEDLLRIEYRIDGFGIVVAQIEFRGLEYVWTGLLTGALGL